MFKKPRKRRLYKETKEQSSLVIYLKAKYPHIKIICSTRGEGLSGKTSFQRMVQGARLKRQGYEKGTPDLFFAWPSGRYSGLFIETKKEIGGIVDEYQKFFKFSVEGAGYAHIFARGAKDGIKKVDAYMSLNFGERFKDEEDK